MRSRYALRATIPSSALRGVHTLHTQPYSVRNSRSGESVPCRMVDSSCHLEAKAGAPTVVVNVAPKNGVLHVRIRETRPQMNARSAHHAG